MTIDCGCLYYRGASPEIQAFTSVVQTAIPKRLGVKVAIFQAFRSPYFPC